MVSLIDSYFDECKNMDEWKEIEDIKKRLGLVLSPSGTVCDKLNELESSLNRRILEKRDIIEDANNM